MKKSQTGKLLPEEMQGKIPPLYSQEGKKDPMVVCKFFDPTSSWTWYVIEGGKQEDDYLFFGYVVGLEAELGYFSLSELENCKQGLTGLRALPIERDLFFTPCKLSQVKREHQ
jgi:hypothetical protein